MTPIPVPARAETSAVSALGIHSPDEGKGRARRELSVIEETGVGTMGHEDVDEVEAEQDGAADAMAESVNVGVTEENGDTVGTSENEELGTETEGLDVGETTHTDSGHTEDIEDTTSAGVPNGEEAVIDGREKEVEEPLSDY